MDITNRIKSLTSSLTLEVTSQAKAMQMEGQEVYGLAGGEPDVDTPNFIKHAAIEALNQGKTKYTPATGITELKTAIVSKFKQDNQINYADNQIAVTSGAKYACQATLLATLDVGDEVIIPAPYWVSYPEIVKLAGGVPVIVETSAESGWKMTAQQFEESMTPSTKMVIINSPGNPTGAVYSMEELKALGEVAMSEDILILSDEIYEKLVYGEAKHTSIASLSEELKELTITVNGFSKSYSMTGWRLGYVAATESITKSIATVLSHTTSNPTTFAQYGALAALNESGEQFCQDLVAEYDIRRQFVSNRLKEIKNIQFVEPQGGFYFFIDTSQLGLNSQNLCSKLLSRQGVAVVPGVAFGNDQSIRLSYCTTLDRLNEGLDKFSQFCLDH